MDVARIVDEGAARQRRSQIRWKRAALVAGSLAAGLLLVLLIRPEIRLENGQLVVRWSNAPSTHVEQPALRIVEVLKPVRDVETEERVRILGDLISALRDDMDLSDRDRTRQIELLMTRLELLQVQAQQRWDETRSDVTALYKAQFGEKDQ